MRIDNLIVDKEKLAQIFGISTITIDGWIRADMPCERRGGKGVSYQFNTADVINWVRERERAKGSGVKVQAAIDPNDPRARTAMAQAKMKELELAQKQGDLLPAQAMLDMVEEQYTAARSRLLLIAARAAPLVAAEEDEAECERILVSEVHEALAELSAKVPA